MLGKWLLWSTEGGMSDEEAQRASRLMAHLLIVFAIVATLHLCMDAWQRQVGTSDNAVKTQVWIAICVYVLVAIVRKELKLEMSLSQILQVLSVNIFEQVPLVELVTKTVSQNETSNSHNKLVFNMRLVSRICGRIH
jgi:hypothetical protein